jgi:phage shock protein PspC (stress-responsive transcriptional regulator)
MNDTTHHGAARTAGPKRLVRTPDRKIAGVAAGIAHYLGIDPTIVRIAFVALAFAGGIGLLLYLICFFVMPKGEIDDRGPADPLDTYAILGLAGLVAGIGLLVGWHGLGGGARAVVAAGLIVGGILLLGRRLGPDGRDGGGPDGGHPVTSPTPPPAPAPAPPAPPSGADLTAATGITAVPAAGAPLAATPYGPIPAQTTREAAPAASRRRAPMTTLVLSTLAIAVAVLLALGFSERVDLTAPGGLAVAVIIVGLGLAVASVTGGAPLLFLVGGLATAGLLVAAATEHLVGHGIGSRTYGAATAAEILPEYRLGIGDLRVDLSTVDLAGATRPVRVDLGIGEARVIVPADVDLQVRGHVRAGSVVLPGRAGRDDDTVEGWDRSVDWTDDIARDNGTLVLDLDLTFGEVVVSRG